MVIAVGLAVENDLFSLRMNGRHLAKQHLHIALLAHQFPERCGDISSGDQPG